MSIRENVEAVIDGTLRGEILETFERYYADDVVMSENGLDDRVGKDVNRQYEQQFVENVEFHGAKVGRITVDGNDAAVEWEFDMTPKGGSRIIQRQVAFQTWKDGKVVREVFYYNAG